MSVLAILGPTASGKSALALDLALRIGGEIVNTDSMQCYIGMDIGTAKPTAEEMARIPHHGFDIWPIEHAVSVAEFQHMARTAIDDVLARGAHAIVVGGSGLYVSAVLDEFEFPGTDPQVRARLEADLADVGPAVMHARLASADPEAARVILASNGRRIVRALEVIEITGRPFAASLPAPVDHYPTTRIGIEIDREALDARITARVERMWAAGFLDEVRRLADLGLAEGRTASLALGYRQILDHLGGSCSEDEARLATIEATRRFARRQQRWFARDSRISWQRFDLEDQVATALAAFTASPASTASTASTAL